MVFESHLGRAYRITDQWNAAFIARPGMKLSRLDPEPLIIVSSLVEVADELLARLG